MKKKKINNISNVIFIILVIVILSILSYNIFSKKTSLQSTTPNPAVPSLAEKEYYSNFLKISFKYKNYFQIKETDNLIYLESENGSIAIEKTGTNYTNLQDHLNALESMNKLNIVERVDLLINNTKSIRAVIKSFINNSSDSYSYFFYPTEWTVYSISTDSNELRNDVDRIAETFVYTP